MNTETEKREITSASIAPLRLNPTPDQMRTRLNLNRSKQRKRTENPAFFVTFCSNRGLFSAFFAPRRLLKTSLFIIAPLRLNPTLLPGRAGDRGEQLPKPRDRSDGRVVAESKQK